MSAEGLHDLVDNRSMFPLRLKERGAIYLIYLHYEYWMPARQENYEIWYGCLFLKPKSIDAMVTIFKFGQTTSYLHMFQ